MEVKSNSSAPHKNKIKVVVRVRPQFDKEEKTWVQVTDKKTLQTFNHRNADETLQYEFESVYGATTNQAVVYNECVKPLLQNCLHGQNASVFAYGPTGAGKTHTILGTATDPGVIPRCIKDIFTSIKEENDKLKQTGDDWTFKVMFSYLEIYQEKVHDLLNPRPVDLPIREDQHKNIFVAALTEKAITDVKQFNELFAPASRNRATAATKLNERSSRSHSILQLRIHRQQKVSPFKRQIGKMYIIDLAGSEDNRRTGNQGVRLKESGAINSSLLALGQVVDALNKAQTCVPYRSSKLTRLLQDSLGGSANTCMIVNLSPEEKHYFNTYTTLHFARKTKKIVNTIKTHEIVDPVAAPVTKPVSKKRPRPKDTNEAESLTPKKQKTEPAPFLSPILKDQEKFRLELKQEMFNRLEELERRILEQMRSCQSKPEISKTVVKADPDSTTEDDVDSQPRASDDIEKLENIMTQLKQFKEEEEATKLKLTSRASLKPKGNGKHKLFSDGSSVLSSVNTQSSSPLFARPPVLKRKGFTSTAAKKFIDTPVTSSSEVLEKENKSMNPNLQQSHNDRILMILNTGSIKELQELQTVGGKRAKLIHAWRDLNGHFSQFDDMRSVHGLTSKYVDNFLRSNLVNV